MMSFSHSAESSWKKGKHFKVEAKIGGGKKVVHVEFKDPKNVEEHRGHLEQLARNSAFTIEIKHAA